MAGINDRQEQLDLSIPRSVAVVGCGGVGSWTAYFLALAGVKQLWLFDHDTISEHNLNRIPLPMSSVGKSKTEAIAEMIRLIRPDCDVLPMGGFSEFIADELKLASKINWIVATTDTLLSRQLTNEWANNHGISYIEAAAEGEYGSVTGEPAEWATPQEAMPGYQSVPVWVGPCVFAAGIAVAHMIHNSNIYSRAIRIGWDEENCEFSMYDSQIEPEENEEGKMEINEQESAEETDKEIA